MARRILVAEDDSEIRRALIDILDLSGYEVRAASNGVEALAVLDNWRPNAIVLDLLMPEMDGPAFLAAFAGRGEGDAIPVIILSAQRDLAAQAAGLPVAVVVAKPFDVDDLLGALKQAGAAP